MKMAKSLLYLLFLFPLSAGTTYGLEGDYWPFQVGNRWKYDLIEYRDVLVLDGEDLVYLDEDSGFIRYFESNEIVPDSLLSNSIIDTVPEPVVIATATMEIVGTEEIDGHTYFRLNTNQLLRKDSAGNIIEFNNRFDSIEALEFILFDFNDNFDPELQLSAPYGPLPPTTGGPQYSFPVGRIPNLYRPLRSAIGDFDSNISFSFRNSTGGGCGVTFALNIGVVQSGCGNDTHSSTWQITEAIISGDSIKPTSISKSTWGQIKSVKH